jgi:glycosyltransferase involved in cell wall biosynthesis
MPKISVIMPTYNRADLLPAAIRSVIAQTYADWELLVVDDGSKDGTKEVVSNFTKDDSRIKYLSQENQGASAARNNGIKNATGEYLAFLDSDDEYLPRNLEAKLTILESRPETIIVNGVSWIVDGATKRITACGSYAPSNWLVRKKFIELSGPFDPRQNGVEDAGMRMRALIAANNKDAEYILREPHVLYFQHPGQISNTAVQRPEIFVRRLESLRSDIGTGGNVFFPEFASYVYSRLGNFYCLAGNMHEGRTWLRNSLSVHANGIAAALLPATFLGKEGYRVCEQALRTFQTGVLGKVKLSATRREFGESYRDAVQMLRAESSYNQPH